jgi:DGQHR domain-containing protein
VKTLKLTALRVRQNQEEFYLTVIPTGQLLSVSEIDRVDPDHPNGYQRPLIESRLKPVVRYLTKEEGVFPTSVLVNVRKEDIGDGNAVTFDPFKLKGDGANPDHGTLTIPDGVKLWIEDGQHRTEGLRYAIDKEGLEHLKDYPIPVTISVGLDVPSEMRRFYVVNTRQRGVPADVAERHLVTMKDTQGAVFLVQIEGEGKLRDAKATKVVDALRVTPNHPWFGGVIFPGEKKTKTKFVRQHTLVSSLREIFKDKAIDRMPEEKVAALLMTYWNALRRRFPNAFADYEHYSIMKTAGMYSLHMVFPDVVELCREARDFSEDKMYEIVGSFEAPPVNMTDEFWNTEPGRGDTLTFGTGMKTLRILGAYLRESLPKPEVLPAA